MDKFTIFNICMTEDKSGFVTVRAESVGDGDYVHHLGVEILRMLTAVEINSPEKLFVITPIEHSQSVQ